MKKRKEKGEIRIRRTEPKKKKKKKKGKGRTCYEAREGGRGGWGERGEERDCKNLNFPIPPRNHKIEQYAAVNSQQPAAAIGTVVVVAKKSIFQYSTTKDADSH